MWTTSFVYVGGDTYCNRNEMVDLVFSLQKRKKSKNKDAIEE